MTTINVILDALLYDAEWFVVPRGTMDFNSWSGSKVMDSYGFEFMATNDEISWFCLLVCEALMDVEYQREQLLLDAMWWFNPHCPTKYQSFLLANNLRREYGDKWNTDKEADCYFSLLIREAISII